MPWYYINGRPEFIDESEEGQARAAARAEAEAARPVLQNRITAGAEPPLPAGLERLLNAARNAYRPVAQTIGLKAAGDDDEDGDDDGGGEECGGAPPFSAFLKEQGIDPSELTSSLLDKLVARYTVFVLSTFVDSQDADDDDEGDDAPAKKGGR